MKLFGEIEPYKTGMLPVSGGHNLYYECSGNKNGQPLLYVHGGPGAGASPDSRRYFDPEIFNIILFDQRGAGKSTPHASLVQNTTKHLVQDISSLLDHLGIEKTILWGGSWGSTLSLCYAIEHPDRVEGMVLRGIFLGSKKEIDYLYRGPAQRFGPDIWERFITQLPEKERKDPINAYFKRIRSKSEETSMHFSKEWLRYESALCRVKPDFKKIDAMLNSDEENPVSFASIEAHFMKHDCYLPPNYVLKNARKIRHIPTSIVQGRYDAVCPPETAYALHKKLPDSRFIMVEGAGHAGSEPGIRHNTMKELIRMEKKIRKQKAKR